MSFSSYDFPEVYEKLGIDVSKLGAVMLAIENLTVSDYLDYAEDDLYFSEHKDRYWIRGAVGETNAHLTLLYGLMEMGHVYEEEIYSVLHGWGLVQIEIEKVDFFDSPFEDDPYYCIVGHVKVTPELLEGHQRLSLLPHINTHKEYRPHVTLAYVKKDEQIRDRWIRELGYWMNGRPFLVQRLDLGRSTKES